MLQKAVAETKAEFDGMNVRSFQYQSLKREAEADKNLYEELVRKIKEASINSGFQNSAIRIADLARPAIKAVFPNITLNVLLALVFSTLLAVARSHSGRHVEQHRSRSGAGDAHAFDRSDRHPARGERLAGRIDLRPPSLRTPWLRATAE